MLFFLRSFAKLLRRRSVATSGRIHVSRSSALRPAITFLLIRSGANEETSQPEKFTFRAGKKGPEPPFKIFRLGDERRRGFRAASSALTKGSRFDASDWCLRVHREEINHVHSPRPRGPIGKVQSFVLLDSSCDPYFKPTYTTKKGTLVNLSTSWRGQSFNENKSIDTTGIVERRCALFGVHGTVRPNS
jgi:hypothetical protein